MAVNINVQAWLEEQEAQGEAGAGVPQAEAAVPQVGAAQHVGQPVVQPGAVAHGAAAPQPFSLKMANGQLQLLYTIRLDAVRTFTTGFGGFTLADLKQLKTVVDQYLGQQGQ